MTPSECIEAGEPAQVSSPNELLTTAACVSATMIAASTPQKSDPQYIPCCELYKKGTLKKCKLEKDVILQGLLAMHENSKPEVAWKALCKEGYHTLRRELTNLAARKKRKLAM